MVVYVYFLEAYVHFLDMYVHFLKKWRTPLHYRRMPT